MQLGHHDIQNRQRSDTLHVLCDGLTTPENVGMVFRIADAFGVGKVYFLGTQFSKENKRVRKTARGAESIIPFENPEDAAFLEKLKSEGFTVFGLEITSDSQDIRSFDFSVFEKKIIVIGSEKHGISPEVLEKCDVCTHISMFGQNTSINVVHALSIGLYAMSP